MRLLVTGGAGFIGSHVAEQAWSDGWNVAVIDDLSSGRSDNLPEGVRLHVVDIRDEQAVAQVFESFRPDVVSHQAAQASVSVSVRVPLLDAEVNLLGGLNVLEASRRYNVRRVVFASTGGAIYGEVPEGARATEQWTPDPLSPYATSKYAFEQYLETYRRQYGLEYTALRYANVYGPRQNPHGEAGVVAIFTRELLAGRAVTVNGRYEAGDDGCWRDYVYVGDVVRANLLAVKGALTERVLNVGTGEATSTRGLAMALMDVLGTRASILDALPRQGDIVHSCLDSGRVRTYLRELTSLEHGLTLTVDWFRYQQLAR